MAQYISNAPFWVTILFAGSFLVALGPIANAAKQAVLSSGMSIEKSKSIRSGVFIFFVTWLAYASVLALTGALSSNTLPPKVILFTTVPLFAVLFLVIGNTGLYKKLFYSTSLESLIRIHVFRLVGVFFIILYFYRVFPAGFAISASMGDIITALLAIPLARAVARKKSWSIKAVYAWNVFGILDIVSAMAFAVVTTIAAAKTGDRGPQEMTMFPFVWFPAFAPGTILFLHAGIFKKLKQLKTANR
ncbi:MAG: hypothetical protein JSU01_22500 [Bacteroidetes bacterium]|nr:hypothetical protein [Bacteroidota bacterium]